MTSEESFEKNVGDVKLFPNHTDKDIWFSGYTQCQKDMADKKYTEEDMRNALNVGMSAEAGDYPKGWSFDCGISLEDYFINSLNKK